jgi:phospholipid/cholesterol/gamma-HCH transport system substrate-binding protein
METRANYVIVGLFTLAVIVGAFGFVFWFHRTAGQSDRMVYRVLFTGSVSGLRTGGAVLFNGIRVGEVTEVKLDTKDPHKVVALISVKRSIPIRADTRTSLDFQGLTGLASLSLTGGTLDAPEPPAEDGEPPTLVADAGATQDLTETAREVLRKIDAVVTENKEGLNQVVVNLGTFTAALANSSERLDKIMAGVEGMTGSGDGKGELPEMLKSVRTLSDNLDKRTADLTSNINRMTQSATRQIESLGVDGRKTMATIEQAVRNFDRNPSRIIFGGGSAASSPPAAEPARR